VMIPVAVVGPTAGGFETIRLDGDMKAAFVEWLADELSLRQGQRNWLHQSVYFKVMNNEVES
jgi:hypothetical protein